MNSVSLRCPELRAARLELARVVAPPVDLAVVAIHTEPSSLRIGWSASGPRIDDGKSRMHQRAAAAASSGTSRPLPSNAAMCCVSGPRRRSVEHPRARPARAACRSIRRCRTRLAPPTTLAKTRSIASSMRSMPKLDQAYSCAARPMRARSASSRISCTMPARAREDCAAGPAGPSCRRSPLRESPPPAWVTAGGRRRPPVRGSAAPLVPEGREHATSAHANHAGTSSWLRGEADVVRNLHRRDARLEMRARGPSPITRSCHPGTSRRRSAQASRDRRGLSSRAASRGSPPRAADRRQTARAQRRGRADGSAKVDPGAHRGDPRRIEAVVAHELAFSASPVTTMCRVARWYSQRVVHELFTGVERAACARRAACGNRRPAIATSHASVELCVLMTSMDAAWRAA